MTTHDALAAIANGLAPLLKNRGAARAVFTGNFTAGSFGGGSDVLDAEGSSLGFDLTHEIDDVELLDALEPLSSGDGPEGTVEVVLEKGGAWQGRMVRAGGASFGFNPSMRLRPTPAERPTELPELQVDVEELQRRWNDGEGYDAEPAATAEEIAAAEQELGFSLPAPIRALVSLANGAESAVEYTDDEPQDTLLLPPWWSIMSLDDIVEAYGRWSGEATSSILAGMVPLEFGPTGRIQARTAHAGWIPFASDGGGNFIALDMAPGPRGHVGQVISFGADVDNSEYFADSFDALIRKEHGDMEEIPTLTVDGDEGDVLAEMEIEDGLQELLCWGPGVADTSVLAGQKDLRHCVFARGLKVDLAGLADVPVLKLRLLGIDADLTPLAHHPTLRVVELTDGTFASLDVVATWPALEDIICDAAVAAELPWDRMTPCTVTSTDRELDKAAGIFRAAGAGDRLVVEEFSGVLAG